MLIKLTNTDGEPILVGVESIIDVKHVVLKPHTGGMIPCTKIESRGAMVTTNWVEESVEDIWKMVSEKVARNVTK